MCGIAGITEQDADLVAAMAERLAHRGPDGEGLFHDEHVTLGHRRLSILDLSERGAQPMPFRRGDDEYVLICNGEIYNFRELRGELEELGARFRSQSDTEVVLAAYAHWGRDCVKRFNGMWAFALYDKSRRTLFLSRDRFGKKPLYYARIGDTLVFASEIKALLLHPQLERKPNEAVIADYLYRTMATHTPETFFEGVHMLPAGHSAEFDLTTRRLAIERYYDLPIGNRPVPPEEILEGLKRGVERRLVSDVPVSLSLSGGIDSSSIAAILATTQEHVTAFSTQSGQRRGDETHLIRALLERYPNIEMQTNPLAADSFIENFRHIIWHMDEPFLGHVPYVRWEVARTCHEHGHKVLLNGEGADELVGGYWISLGYFMGDMLRSGRWGRMTRELRALSGTKELRTVLTSMIVLSLLPSAVARRVAGRRDRGLQRRYGIRLDAADISSELGAMKQMDGKHALKRLVTEMILPHLLMCNDKMSMSNSVEARCPFLDYEFAELAMQIPAEDLVVDGLRKHPLREAVRGLVPAEILDRKQKDYFSAPTKEYLRHERMAERVRELFADARTASVLDPRAVLDDYDALLDRKSANKSFLLRAICLEEWMRVFDVAA
ncbi:MAG: asparagine synthase (glutamine-hydrolyzing) [Planctomycetota bacterium]|jgi:asparagine synthase (glutamine-hydrolysing)